MIVNPRSSGREAFFLGEDGTLYQVQGLGEGEELQGLGQFFLGEDGALYQVQGFGADVRLSSVRVQAKAWEKMTAPSSAATSSETMVGYTRSYNRNHVECNSEIANRGGRYGKGSRR